MKSSSDSSSRLLRLLPLALLLFVPSLAQAHVQTGHTGGFLQGATHPLTGLDHLCAMVAVGLWAAQRGERALWLVPLTFVAVMALGGALGMAAIPLPLVEQGIVASVLILGVLTAAAIRMPLVASMIIVGLFALVHGHAHGVEMPETASDFTYAAGFMLMTASLHLCGIGLAMLVKRLGSSQLIRYACGAVTVCGVYLCLT